MDPSRSDRILEEWDAVASQARRPAAAPRPVVVRSALSGSTLLGATMVAIVLVLAVGWLGSHRPNPSVGATPPPAATTRPDPTATAEPTATPRPTIAACRPVNLTGRITMWEGAAGHRIAHVEVTLADATPCVLETEMRPQLVDGTDRVLIDGTAPKTTGHLVLAQRERVTTLVDADNYCGSAPKPPVSLAFVFGGGMRLLAVPASPNDTTLPPCNGAGSAAQISMHPWSR